MKSRTAPLTSNAYVNARRLFEALARGNPRRANAEVERIRETGELDETFGVLFGALFTSLEAMTGGPGGNARAVVRLAIDHAQAREQAGA